MTCKNGSVLYVVDLGGNDVYVGSTTLTPEERYAKHKAGGRTSVKVVRLRGRGLRYDLVQPGEREESALAKRLRAAGYKVYGSPKPFCGPPGYKGKKRK